MIKTEREIIKAIFKLTNSYNDELCYYQESSALAIIEDYHNIINSVHIDISPDEAIENIQMLINSGHLRIVNRWLGGFSFSMTALLKHRMAFWWDSFTSKFIGGFILGLISGIISTVIGGLLLAYIRLKLGI